MVKVKKNVTIVDVAEKAGVSKTTISRYLNGKFEFMSAESKAKIAQVIEELGYRPNKLARSLKSQRSRIIGVVVSDISSPFSSILLKGISDCCDRYGYGVMITSTDDDPRKEREYIESMLDQRVEGIIVNTTGENNEFLERVALSIPIILADRPVQPMRFDTIRTADVKYTTEAMRHLKSRGFERVAFFSEPLKNIGTRVLRCEAYNKACDELFGIEPQVYIINKRDEVVVDSMLKDFISKNGAFRKAIYTTNGVTTMQVVKSMQRLGLKFPQDIGLCGFDDWEWTSLVDGGITVISQPSYKVGRECVKRMMFRLHRNRNAAPRMIELDCELIVRHST